MFTYEIETTLNNAQDSEWDELVSKNIGTASHSSVREGFLLSRQALLRCFEKLGIKLRPSDLELESFSQLKTYPGARFSLSHCKGAGAAIISSDPKIFPGIDIESVQREVSERVLQKVSHPQDTKLKKIEIWCIKESAFKSLMNTGRFVNNVNFADIRIEDGTWSHSPSGLSGKWELKMFKKFVVALSELEI